MSKQYNKLSAFKAFGTKQTNQRWGWAAIAEDKSTVAVTIWKDRIKLNDKKPYYDGFDEHHEKSFELWGGEKGNNDRKKHLKYAIENLDSLVRVVLIKAVDENAYPREIGSVYPYEHMWFKITKFNEETGQFRLEFHDKDES